MKNLKITWSGFLVFLLLFYGGLKASRACDVSTYVAMLKAEKISQKKIPEQKTSKDLIIGYTEGTKYMVRDFALSFEKKNKGFTAFPQELKNVSPGILPDKLPAESKSTEKNMVLPMLTPLKENKTDLIIVPALINSDNKVLHSVSDWAVTFASDEIILVFGGSGKHKEAMKKLTWKEIVENKDYRMIVATKGNTCLSHFTKQLLAGINTVTPANKGNSGENLPEIQRSKENPGNLIEVGTAQEVIEKVVKGEADYGFIYKSIATTYTMLTKELPENINQQKSISYGFAVKRDSTNYYAASLFAESMLNTDGFLQLKATGFIPISGGKISFRTK